MNKIILVCLAVSMASPVQAETSSCENINEFWNMAYRVKSRRDDVCAKTAEEVRDSCLAEYTDLVHQIGFIKQKSCQLEIEKSEWVRAQLQRTISEGFAVVAEIMAELPDRYPPVLRAGDKK